MKFILILFILFVSCSNKIIYEDKLQKNEIKALEVAILDAKKSSYTFKDWTEVYVFFGTWEEYIIHESNRKKYKNQKMYSCIDKNSLWLKHKKYLHDKNNKFYYIKIGTECIDALYAPHLPVRDFGDDVYILFINKNYDIVYREINKSRCKTNL